MKKILFFVLLNCFLLRGYSQSYVDPNTISPPSVNNSFSISNTDYSVNLYTGTVAVNVPIYTLQSKEISIPISLSYNGTRGIKVQDVANFMGLGWQLEAGGRITRLVRGLPDDGPKGYIGTNASGSSIVSLANNTGGSTSILNQIAAGQVDGEPDIFSVSTPFFSFQFSFDENGVPVFPNSTEYVVSGNLKNNSDYLNSSIVVKDGMGNQYYFGSSSNSRENATAKLYNTSTTFISTWYLDKIVTFNNKDNVLFNYTSASNYTIDHSQSTRSILTEYGLGNSITSNKPSDYNTTISTTYNSPKYIASITTSLGKADFNYLFDRRDVINGARLVSIKVSALNPLTFLASNLLKTYLFNYAYFGDPSSDPNRLRLRLDNITISGNTPSTLAPITLKSFTYNTTNNLPARNSVEFDYWDYYNVNTSGVSLVPAANKAPDLSRASANVLTAIKDVSGETIKFQYELNDYYDNDLKVNKSVGGLRIAQISKTSSLGDNIVTKYSYAGMDNKSTGQIFNKNYSELKRNLLYQINFCVLNGTLGVCGATGVDLTVSESIYNTFDLNGVFTGYSSITVLSPNGGTEKYTYTNFSDFPDQRVPISGYQLGSTISLAYKRGVLLNKLICNSNGDKIKEFQYAYGSLNTPIQTKSYGISPIPVYSSAGSWNIAQSSYNLYYTNVENYRLTKAIEKDYDQKNTANFTSNSTQYTYGVDKRLVKSTLSSDSKNIQILKTAYYPGDINVQPTIPLLTNDERTAVDAMLTANRINEAVHITTEHGNFGSAIHNSYVSGSSYNSNIYLNSVSEYNGSVLVKQQFFNYDFSTSNLISIKERDGKSTSFQYGYNSSYPVAKVANASSTSKATPQPSVVYGSVNSGSTKTFTLPVAGTISLSISFGSYPGAGNTTSGYYTLIGPSTNKGETLCYSTITNGCSYPSLKTFNNMPAGNYTLYASLSTNFPNSNPFISYNYTSVSSVITNESEFFYDGFEQTGTTTTTQAHTGSAYWTSNYLPTFNPPAGRSYVIQWWSLVNGNWRFNESPYTSNMTLTGPVDDVRIFPNDALMTTYTSNPLVGKTSETDATGRSNTTEYDGLGRVNVLRDNDRNIISKTCYSYNWQPGSCSGIFKNELQSKTFTRTNCAAGYAGGSISYSVPVGKYESFKSVEEANQWAINDLNTNGPTYANANASCSVQSFNVNLLGTERKGITFYITFTDVTSGSLYNKTLNANSGGISIGQIPSGTYNIKVCPANNTSSSNTVVINNYYQAGVGCLKFNNVLLSPGSTTITNY